MAQQQPQVQEARARVNELLQKGLDKYRVVKIANAEFFICVYATAKGIFGSYMAQVVNKRTGEVEEKEKFVRLSY